MTGVAPGGSARRGPTRDANREGIAEVAAAWLVRRAAGDWSETQERELAAWLETHPSHRREFEAFQSLWSEIDQVPLPLTPGPAAARRERRPRRWFAWSLAGACAAVIIALTGLFASHRAALPVYQQAFTTAARQRLEAPLPDGSTVVLNVSSDAVVTYYRDRREVSLARGEAFFDVMGDAARPFVVRARDVTIRVTGTRFNVYLATDDVRVGVGEGSVELSRDAGEQRVRLLLRGGEGLRAGRTVTRHAVTLADVAAWRSGQIVFRDQPLADVLVEVSRYRASAISLASPELGRQRLSGVFNVDNPEGFLDALPLILPLRIGHQPDGAVVVMARK